MVQTPSLHRLTSSVTAVIIFFSVFSSILSTLGYIQFIPAVFAISGAATAWTSYRQTDLLLVQTNAAINQLNQLVIWWDSLSMIEKRVGANKEFLVCLLYFLFPLHVCDAFLSSFCNDLLSPLSLPYLSSFHLTLINLTSPHLALPYLTLPYLTLPYLTSPYLSFSLFSITSHLNYA